MSNNMQSLKDEQRLLIEAELKPLQGHRFQPTGFPDLGAATYTLPDGTEMLLVESCQSMANRFEEVCWDKQNDSLIEELEGLPYISVEENGKEITNTLQEAHRINSEYIMKAKGDTFKIDFEKQIEYNKNKKRPPNWHKFYKTLLKYDPNNLLHGVMLEEIAGILRFPRVLSAFIEAERIQRVDSGGVKFDRVNPSEKGGGGNVPYHRTEFAAEKITAFFNVDLAQIRAYGLEEKAQSLLFNLALYKIRRFFRMGLRLRTACDLEVVDITVTRPKKWTLPEEKGLAEAVKKDIKACKNLFASPAITVVNFKEKSTKDKKETES